MKIKFFSMLLFAVIFTSCRKNYVEISGIVEFPVTGGYIFLEEMKSSELVSIDSAILYKDGGFNFRWKVKHPAYYRLKINYNNFLTLLVSPGERIKFTSHYDSLSYPAVISGSKGTELMVEYNKHLRKTINKLSDLSTVYELNLKNPDRLSIIDSLENLAHEYLNEINTYTKKYIDNNISSLVSLVALYQQVAPNVYVLNPASDFSYYLRVDSSLFNLYPDYGPVIDLHEQVEQYKSNIADQEKYLADISGGNMIAPEISLPSPEGDTIKLSSTRGSIVLLDFWAAWCTPCRVENPNLLKAYEMYHEKGFQIFQVSLDKTKDAWLKGIKDDRLEKWIHVSDVKYWNSIVIPLYRIESIPANFLLDREGRVIASNLRGEALLSKLSELFK